MPMAISRCLLGEAVRYDGASRHDAQLVEALAPYCQWLPVCPEVEIGLPVPRPPMRLVRGEAGSLRLVEVDDPTREHTAPSIAHATHWANHHPAACGFIGKGRSPSCGWGSVALHRPGDGGVDGMGSGLFITIWKTLHPQLPVIDAESLHQPGAVERFLKQARAYRQRLRDDNEPSTL